MKQIITYILFCFFSSHFLYSQTNEGKNRPYTFSAVMGIGRTEFDVKGFLTEDYPALIVCVGGGVSRTILGRRLQLVSGLNIYYRAKSKSPLKNDTYSGKGFFLPSLDETAIERHIATEIPLSVRYLLNGGRSVSAGFMTRLWGANDLADKFASQTEFGYILGVNQRIFTDFTVGLDFYWGFTDFYRGSVLSSGGESV